MERVFFLRISGTGERDGELGATGYPCIVEGRSGEPCDGETPCPAGAGRGAKGGIFCKSVRRRFVLWDSQHGGSIPDTELAYEDFACFSRW